MKALLIDIAGGPKVLEGKFNEDLYAKYSDELWVYLNQLKILFMAARRSLS